MDDENRDHDADDSEYENVYLNFWYDPISDQVVFQLHQEDIDYPNEMECDMCGKQNNPLLRPGRSYMCSTCWMIWNS